MNVSESLQYGKQCTSWLLVLCVVSKFVVILMHWRGLAEGQGDSLLELFKIAAV